MKTARPTQNEVIRARILSRDTQQRILIAATRTQGVEMAMHNLEKAAARATTSLRAFALICDKAGRT